VGVDQMVKPGDQVKPGSRLVRIHANCETEGSHAVQRLGAAFYLGDSPPTTAPLINES